MSSSPDPKQQQRDSGSALIMALVMIVIGAMFVASAATYANSVFRANRVLSQRTKESEAVKSGLRMALASPRDLYEYCGPQYTGANVTRPLPTYRINGEDVITRCKTIDVAAALADDQRRFGLVATRLGETIPPELTPEDVPPSDPPQPQTRFDLSTATDARAWLDPSVMDEETRTGKIWRPRLPWHGTSIRSANGTTMPEGWPSCRVYFPGTYVDPVLLDGPTFFASGVYYFEAEVKVVAGANVVVGDGAVPACTDEEGNSIGSQDALYYANRVPGEHNVNGYGATMVFGSRGRLVITNDPGELNRSGSPVGVQPISFVINRRYNQQTDYPFLPSSDVAIITVDGEMWDHDDDPTTPNIPVVCTDADGNAIGACLDAPGRIYVPESIVGADDPSTEGVDEGKRATDVSYVPSVFTPKLVRPDPPTWPASGAVQNRGSGRVLVTWQAPPFDGGAAITRYRVTASSGQSCETLGALSCLVTGLPTGSPVTFRVEAFNRSDASDPELEVASLPSAASPSITASGTGSANPPTAPGAPSVTLYYDERATTDPANSLFAHISWNGATANNAPITGYEVVMERTDGGPTLSCVIDMTNSWVPDGWSHAYPRTPEDLHCDIPVPLQTGAVTHVLPEYRVRVRATNAMGTQQSSQTIVAAVPASRADMPEECLLLVPVVPPDGVITDAELSAWLTDTPLPTEECALLWAPAPYIDATELYDHDGDAGTPEVPRHAAHVVPPRDGQPPIPVVEIRLDDSISPASAPVVVDIGSYVSLAQGRIKVVNRQGHDVSLTGGVMAAMFDVDDNRRFADPDDPTKVVAGSVPIGYLAAVIQNKIEIISTSSSGRVTSTAIVQINKNGAYAVNSWRVQ